MGFEYTIKLKFNSENDLAAVLRQITGFSKVDPRFGGFQFRSEENHDPEMPNAEARIRKDGIYFCSYGGAEGQRFLSEVIVALLAKFNEVTVAKLDWE